MKKNVYKHGIELAHLRIKNKPREEFRKHLEEVKYRGYEVEQLEDGRKNCNNKTRRQICFW
jgi:hypothetical protein